MLRTARLLPLLRALDTGLRRRALPPDAASLLPGSLAITWTGLPPAGGDELADATRSDHRTHRPPIQSRVSSGHAGRYSNHANALARIDWRCALGERGTSSACRDRQAEVAVVRDPHGYNSKPRACRDLDLSGTTGAYFGILLHASENG